MKASYTYDEVFALLAQAVEAAEQDIYRGLRGASSDDRLNKLVVLDALHLVEKNIQIKLETSE